IWTE
ncbi:pvsB domain protein, partial [Vibrio harveyi]